MSYHLDLGCGNTPRNPYKQDEVYGVDINCSQINTLNFKEANLFAEQIPFESNYFDSVSAYDFIEHIPRIMTTSKKGDVRYSFIEVMYEIWRVLKPGGFFLASTPFFPNPEVFVDPTHVNFITDKTHSYFCGDSPLAKIYGFQGQFKIFLNGNLVENTLLKKKI
jgi:SAM-dependent methyltransferase